MEFSKEEIINIGKKLVPLILNLGEIKIKPNVDIECKSYSFGKFLRSSKGNIIS
jgi:hypothetical protein